MIKTPSKFKEFLCFIFGHDFTEFGSEKNEEFSIVVHEYKKCSQCGAEFHDRSGYKKLYDLKYK